MREKGFWLFWGYHRGGLTNFIVVNRVGLVGFVQRVVHGHEELVLLRRLPVHRASSPAEKAPAQPTAVISLQQVGLLLEGLQQAVLLYLQWLLLQPESPQVSVPGRRASDNPESRSDDFEHAKKMNGTYAGIRPVLIGGPPNCDDF